MGVQYYANRLLAITTKSAPLMEFSLGTPQVHAASNVLSCPFSQHP